MKFCRGIAFVFFVFPLTSLFAQEALKSVEEEYYNFLSLQGMVSRPSLNYRTLSDSEWNIADGTEHVWFSNNLGVNHILFTPKAVSGNAFLSGVNQNIAFKLFGPEWFNSFNTAAPYGQNDGALWQGRGYNTSLTAGIRFEAYGLEMTFKPQLSFSQNMAFDILPSAYDSEYGYFWGYGWGSNVGIDSPQRFGNSSFFTFDWGDSEIRYTWKSLTVGFGTQSIWLGPAYLNPVLHSNNAASYPKVDVGFRRTQIRLPWLGWYIGDMEARIWTGYLSESDYFDNNDANNHNMIHGLAFAYAPSFLPGLTFFANRICLVKWDWENLIYVIPAMENTHVGESNAGEDQKMSFGFDWVFEKIGFELYAEIGMDDFLQGGFIKGLSRYPFDSMVATFGFKKSVSMSFFPQVKGELIFEYANFEQPRNKIKNSQYAFNMHHQITQGFTNGGQAIASPLGVGGNSQLLKFNLYYSKGKSSVTLSRSNPDDTYMYWKSGNENQWYKANVSLFMESFYFINNNISVFGGLGWNWIINPYYDVNKEAPDVHNLIIQAGIKFYW